MPTSMSDPMPAASMPGTSTTGNRGPPSPAASITTIEAISGDSKIIARAANVPAAAITAVNSSVASFLTRRMTKTPRPPPSAMSGASGPRTTPSPMPATAARRTLGSSIGWVTPVLSPSAGT